MNPGRPFEPPSQPRTQRTAKTTARPASARLPSLTGLRFAAAGAVVYTHARLLVSPHLVGTFGPEVWVSMSSVSLFFILSGYLLTHSARPTDTAWTFWRRRAAKILPNHVFTWCVAVAVLVGAGGVAAISGAGAAALVANLLLVNTWIPSSRFVFAGNPVSWSLAAEMFFYLLFPVLLPRVERLSRRGLLIGSAMAIAVVWTWPVLCGFVINPAGAFFPGYWFLYVLPVTRLPEFLLGMMVARLSMTGGRLPRVGAVPAGLSAVGMVVFSGDHLSHTFMYAAVNVVPLALLVHATARLDLEGKPSLLRARPVVFLGEISYAMYLVHALVLTAAFVCLTDRGWSRGAAVVVALPLVPLASWLLYVTVERPCMRQFATARRCHTREPSNK
ncbi:acyltransferase family protein [Streptomyces silvisoli]|uniref:Acyltransferase n=1 Tax=Streptomyces silvisoli TaxID=3034235 RepID=A0ABT5ZFY4_9ACTN|nr:acyltransferase [Streptomyces silvisoli]MDF3288721.1 acyltransferase [Streptomyces silvisoli]